ncbi:hypothetical protein QN277_003861 [Acacia crassicarpa]|uniref:Transposase MuDR plant domain-containing protein n=1 Tax=Acacia crassicarpa TaxID=499986 RepID=A0AAE1IZF1_9FABA|nr:hypothetical protein QN277_003861 [Acacia crassicarpa]
MASNGKEKVVIGVEDRNTGQRSVESVLEKYESAIKGWEQMKTRLRGGHKSVKESILNAVGDREHENTVRQDAEKIVDETTVKGNVEGLIEEMEWGDDYGNYDDIEFLGDDDMNDISKETDRVNQAECENISEKGKGIVDLEEDDEEGHCSDDYCHRSTDDDSYDGTYVGLTSSTDMDESVDDEFECREVDVDPLSDSEEDGLGRDSDDGPMQEPNVLQETEAAATRPYFFVGMTFQDKQEVKRAINKYSITRGVSLKVVRSDKRTYQVVCEEGCPFSLYLSTYGLNIGWQVKSLAYDHKCARVYKNQRASTMWLAQYFKERVQEAPNFKAKDMKNKVQRDRKVYVSVHKCKRAKKKIMEEMDGSYKDGFSKLEAYCNELKLSNPGSDVCVEVSEEALEQGRRVFKRLYLCFNAAKVGWKEGCRPLVVVDGTFLKGKARGIMLTAVGIDGNDSVYPLALAVVEKENAHHWSWFLQWLRHSLDLGNGETVTLISDMQKVITCNSIQ